MKITKSAYLGQNSGGGHEGGQTNFLGIGKGSPRPPAPLGETLFKGITGAEKLILEKITV